MLSSRHAARRTHHSFPHFPTGSCPRSPSLAAAFRGFLVRGCPFCLLRLGTPQGPWSYDFPLPPHHTWHQDLPTVDAPRSLEGRLVGPDLKLAYSTSVQRLDGTVARAKSGVFWHCGEEGRETRAGAPGTPPGWVWFRHIAGMQDSSLTSIESLPFSRHLDRRGCGLTVYPF